MASPDIPKEYAEIDGLLDANDLPAARAGLEELGVDDERFAVLWIKLELYDGKLPAGAAMQRLIDLMRREPDWPGAKALYQEASNLAYQTRQSSVSHSHPPAATRKPRE